jgi:transposase-like protein
MSKTYSPEFKLQVVLEALTSNRTDAEIARAYEVHPVTLSNWKKKLKEDGAKAFGGDNELKEKEKKIAKLERMIGQKEVEIALLRSPISRGQAFWARADHDRKSPPGGSAQTGTRTQPVPSGDRSAQEHLLLPETSSRWPQ